MRKAQVTARPQAQEPAFGSGIAAMVRFLLRCFFFAFLCFENLDLDFGKLVKFGESQCESVISRSSGKIQEHFVETGENRDEDPTFCWKCLQMLHKNRKTETEIL